MEAKVKTFDCVEMMHRAQQKLRAEYQERRSEFSSYVDFINRTMDEHPWARDLLASCRAGRKTGESGA